jgi:predicted DNA-binding ArsR family transcriptional regulator
LHQDENYDLDDFSEEQELDKESKKILKRLDKVVHTDLIINYYEEDDQKPDKAVNIFVRINSGGTYLSFSDILMSIAVANWKEKDARNEIYNLVDNIGSKGFNISKDYVLKAFLFLYHKDVRSMITSFNNGFIVKIEENWEKIRNSILSLFDLAKSYGLTDYTLTSYNATLPILYYLYHRDIYEDFATKKCYETERESIRRWLFSILLRKTFGGQGDAVLTQARRAFTNDIETELIKSLNDFPVKEINTEIKKLTDVGDDFIEELLLTQKDSRYSFPILAMLYPDMDYKNNNFHQDHLHPASTYDQLKQEHKDKFGWTVYNSILNLQMLDSNENMSKNATPLGIWITEQTKNKDKDRFIESHLIPNVDYSLENFDKFIVERKKILIEKLKNILN